MSEISGFDAIIFRILRLDSNFYFNGQSFVDKRIKETACRSYFLLWQIVISIDQKSM